jgi:hypothetical protein
VGQAGRGRVIHNFKEIAQPKIWIAEKITAFK